MSARLLDGAALARRIRESLRRPNGPRLAIIRGTDDEASAQYRRAKLKACREAGIETVVLELDQLKDAARDPKVNAIIVELPLPAGAQESAALEALPPAKDAEGVSPLNFGRLMMARSWRELKGLPLPCTAWAVVQILLDSNIPIKGQEAVVIGRSNIVGKPAAHMLSLLGATVTLCHSKTRDLAAHVRRADILVAAAGIPGLIRGEWIKPGAAVVDAASGTGDVEFEPARQRAGFITPVPGGVGPVTTASLLSNIALLCRR